MAPSTSSVANDAPYIDRIAAEIGRIRLPVGGEKKMQAALSAALDQIGIAHQREVKLGDGDIVDFMIGDIALELKIKGQPVEILRQCERYASHEGVEGLVLMTAKAMSMPSELLGKPVRTVFASAAWL